MIVSLRKSGKPEASDPSLVVSLRPTAGGRSEGPGIESQSSDETTLVEPAATRTHSARGRSARARPPRFLAAIGIALCVIVGLGFMLSHVGQPVPEQSNATSQASIDALIAHVGSLILLPQGEVPTVATVTDLNALKGQAFFAHASLGDKVLMYPKAREAVLYDPHEDKVIQLAPLTVSAASQ